MDSVAGDNILKSCQSLQSATNLLVFIAMFLYSCILLFHRGVIMGPPVQQNKLRNPRKQNVPLRMNPTTSSNNSSGAPSPNTNLSWVNLNGMKQK